MGDATIEARWGDRPVSVPADPDPPRVEGRHAFTIAALFEVRDPGRTPLLDAENLRALPPAFCWWCRAAADDGTPCPGHPG